jgi:nucleoside 2-deoxyribosyltransferase
MMEKVVVLLPEGKLFDQLFAEAILLAIPGARRLAAEFSSEASLAAICEALGRADLVIADLTGKNPNVMYEVGIARGMGKPTLLIAQHIEDFPFDKEQHPVIAYATDRKFLRAELEAFVKGGGVHRKQSAEQDDAARRFKQVFGDILQAHGYEHRGEIQLENPTTFVLLNQDMDLALVQDLARKARELGLRLKLM